MDNVLKMNDLSLDQLANLWNVFTKCAESLESGRRLENLSWRLWFREAHILPPDTSLSDLTDFTPLDTPLISRANSITGSYRPVRLSSTTTARSGSALSDPEDGSDSDYSTDSERGSPCAAPLPSAPVSSPVKRKIKLDQSNLSRTSTSSSSAATTVASSTTAVVPQRARIADSIAERTSRTMITASRRSNLADMDLEGSRRKRGISSSSAFGSKARVKQRNQEGSLRRRPLSFQTALENLVLTSRADNFASLRGTQGSMPHLDVHMNASTGALDAPRRQIDQGNDAKRNSAPAELSPIQSSSIAQAALATQLRKALQPPPAQMLTTPLFSTAVPADAIEVHCDAPETCGPLSPDKMTVALAPTIGAISRRGSQTMLSDANNSGHKEAAVASAPHLDLDNNVEADSAKRLAFSAQHHMPPPSGVLEPTPAASAIKQRAKADQQASTLAQIDKASTDDQHHGTQASLGMVRSDSASSASTQASHRSAANGAGVRRTSEARIRSRPSAGALHAGNRSKSSSGLHRGAKHSKSSDRIAAPARPPPRHNLLSGLVMTRAAPAPKPTHAVARKPVPAETQAPKSAAAATKKVPVKFTMGGDETDSEEYEDESSDDTNAAKPVSAPTATDGEKDSKAIKSTSADEIDDDDEWSSDPEAEEQDRRANQAAEAERRKREEEERHRSMFQKQAIRSKSAADLRLLAPNALISTGPSPPEQPVRGLLSSLFHPDEQHSPPGQLAGRPHASAADLRTKSFFSSQPTASGAARSPPAVRRPRAHRDSNDNTSHAPRSLREGGFAGLTGLKTSKSAVALPLLDTHITRSSTGGGKVKHDEQSVAGGSHHSDGSASSPDSPVAAASFGRPGSMALARLHALTNMKAHSKRSSTGNGTSEEHTETRSHLRRQGSEAAAQFEREVSSRSLRLEVSPDDRDFAIPSRASQSNLAHSQLRQSAPSLSSRHSDQQHLRSSERDVLGSGSRSNSEGLPMGHGSMQQSGTSMNGPVSISRPRSSINLPEAAAPQTPRTTRRNMLRDELSESLRQNLLWERQSRSRMLGLGAPMAPINQPQPQAPGHRRDNVLNGNALRPLTSAGTSRADQRNEGEPKPKRYSEEWGSFHHKGW